jgi:hypothetical protein
MDCKELKVFYEKVTESPHFMVYLTLQNKLRQVCESFDGVFIDITSDDKTFDNLMKFNKQALDVLEDMEKIWSKIDSSKQAELRASQREAGEASLESMLKKFRE